MTPIASVIANPLTIEVPKAYSIVAVISEETFEAQIDDQARLNPKSRALTFDLPQRSSSFILSNIKILASTAIPIDKINPAIPAKVKVTGGKINRPVLKKAKIKIV